MTRPVNHLDEGALLLYINGEPDGRRSQTAAAHVAQCDLCRTRVDDIKTAFTEFCGYWSERKAGVAPVPQPWMDLEPQMRIREQLQQATGRSKLAGWIRATTRRPWVMGIAVAAVAAQIWYVGKRWREEVPAKPPVPIAEAPRTMPPAAKVLPSPAGNVRAASVRPHDVSTDSQLGRRAARELDVVAMLHRIGADLGEPIEIGSSETAFELTATSIEPERERQIRESFAGMPDVRLRFVRAGRAAPDLQPKSPGKDDEDRRASGSELAEPAGSAAAREALAARAMESSAILLARLHALEDLEHRFPAEIRVQFTVSESKVLEQIRLDHLEHARRSARELQSMVDSMGTARQESPAATPSNLSLQENARRLDEAIGVVLGRAPTRWTRADALAELYGRLGLVRRQLENLQ